MHPKKPPLLTAFFEFLIESGLVLMVNLPVKCIMLGTFTLFLIFGGVTFQVFVFALIVMFVELLVYRAVYGTQILQKHKYRKNGKEVYTKDHL